MNIAIYIDYENVCRRLRKYNVHPIDDLNFFTSVVNYFKQIDCNILKLVAYANFEDSDFSIQDQTKIHNYGVNVKHTSIDGKSSADMELVVDVLKDLYKMSVIDMFVIISNDRDYIPLIQAIKLENKKTFVLSTKNGFNEVVNVFADYHQFIEDLFEFQSRGFSLTENSDSKIVIGIDSNEITEDLDIKAKEISLLLYKSNIWQGCQTSGKPIGLNGYVDMVNLKVWKHEEKKSLIKYFHVAHTRGYVELYLSDDDRWIYIREGKNITELFPEKEVQNEVVTKTDI